MSATHAHRTARRLGASLVCLLVVGCGASGQDSAEPAEPSARTKANRLCVEWTQKVEQNGPLPVEGFDPDQPQAEQLPAVGAHFAPVVAASEAIADELRGTDGDGSLSAFVAALDAENENARAQSEAALAGDVDSFRATLGEVEPRRVARVVAARRLGAPACARL